MNKWEKLQVGEEITSAATGLKVLRKDPWVYVITTAATQTFVVTANQIVDMYNIVYGKPNTK